MGGAWDVGYPHITKRFLLWVGIHKQKFMIWRTSLIPTPKPNNIVQHASKTDYTYTKTQGAQDTDQEFPVLMYHAYTVVKILSLLKSNMQESFDSYTSFPTVLLKEFLNRTCMINEHSNVKN